MEDDDLAAAINRGELSLPDLIEISARTSPAWRAAQTSAVIRLAGIDDPQAREALLDVARRGDALPTRAVRTIVPRGDKSLVGPLIEALSIGDYRVRNAVFLLGETQSEAAVEPLTRLMRTADGEILTYCAEALGKIASRAAVPALIEAARHEWFHVRLAALRALRRIGDSRATQVALAATDDVSPGIRAAAIRLLAEVGGPESLGRLLAFAEGPHKRAALAGIHRLADPRSQQTLAYVIYAAYDRRTRHLAGRALLRSTQGKSVWGFSSYFDDVHVRRVAVWLWGYGEEPYGLIHALRDSDALVRARAAASLGRLGSPEGVPPLRSVLYDPEPRVRANAVTALRKLGEDVSSMRGDPHPDVRAAAGTRQP